MKTLLLLCLSLLAPWSSLLAAEPPRVLFRVEFSPSNTVQDVACTVVSKDAEGFSVSRPLRASELSDAQRAQFAALQAMLSASANAGGWRLTGGEMAQTGTAADYQTVPNPQAGEEGQPDTITQPIPGTERVVITLWQTQVKDGKTRYQTMTSEQWPAELRGAVLALWAWLQTAP